MRCAVSGCKNDTISSESHKSIEKIEYYKFPIDKTLRLKWIKFCRTKDDINVSKARICSEHFSFNDFEDVNDQHETTVQTRRNMKKLKDGTVPTINITEYDGKETVNIGKDVKETVRTVVKRLKKSKETVMFKIHIREPIEPKKRGRKRKYPLMTNPVIKKIKLKPGRPRKWPEPSQERDVQKEKLQQSRQINQQRIEEQLKANSLKKEIDEPNNLLVPKIDPDESLQPTEPKKRGRKRKYPLKTNQIKKTIKLKRGRPRKWPESSQEREVQKEKLQQSRLTYQQRIADQLKSNSLKKEIDEPNNLLVPKTDPDESLQPMEPKTRGRKRKYPLKTNQIIKTIKLKRGRPRKRPEPSQERDVQKERLQQSQQTYQQRITDKLKANSLKKEIDKPNNLLVARSDRDEPLQPTEPKKRGRERKYPSKTNQIINTIKLKRGRPRKRPESSQERDVQKEKLQQSRQTYQQRKADKLKADSKQIIPSTIKQEHPIDITDYNQSNYTSHEYINEQLGSETESETETKQNPKLYYKKYKTPKAIKEKTKKMKKPIKKVAFKSKRLKNVVETVREPSPPSPSIINRNDYRLSNDNQLGCQQNILENPVMTSIPLVTATLVPNPIPIPNLTVDEVISIYRKRYSAIKIPSNERRETVRNVVDDTEMRLSFPIPSSGSNDDRIFIDARIQEHNYAKNLNCIDNSNATIVVQAYHNDSYLDDSSTKLIIGL